MIIATLLKIEVVEVCIYPFGGLTKFNTKLNIESYKEFLILIGGPITQILSYYIIYFFYTRGYISINIIEKLTIIHKYLLSFNLLPIIPLDGGKLLNLILNQVISYNLSNKLSVYISILTVIVSLICIRTVLIKTLLITILLKIAEELRNLKYRYNKFLTERYIYNFEFNKTKIVKSIYHLYRGKKHIIKEKGIYENEKEYLTKYLHIC